MAWPMSPASTRCVASTSRRTWPRPTHWPGWPRAVPAEPVTNAHAYLARQQKFAEAHGLAGWLIEIGLARALLHQAEGKVEEARRTLRPALAVDSGAANITVRLPQDVGVRVEVDAGPTVVDAPDLTKNGNVYTNDAYGAADVTLNVKMDAGIGWINLDVVD